MFWGGRYIQDPITIFNDGDSAHNKTSIRGIWRLMAYDTEVLQCVGAVVAVCRYILRNVWFHIGATPCVKPLSELI